MSTCRFLFIIEWDWRFKSIAMCSYLLFVRCREMFTCCDLCDNIWLLCHWWCTMNCVIRCSHHSYCAGLQWVAVHFVTAIFSMLTGIMCKLTLCGFVSVDRLKLFRMFNSWACLVIQKSCLYIRVAQLQLCYYCTNKYLST